MYVLSNAYYHFRWINPGLISMYLPNLSACWKITFHCIPVLLTFLTPLRYFQAFFFFHANHFFTSLVCFLICSFFHNSLTNSLSGLFPSSFPYFYSFFPSTIFHNYFHIFLSTFFSNYLSLFFRPPYFIFFYRLSF